MESMARDVRLIRSPISVIGMVMTTVSAMLFLVVFGIHVERSMGPLRFLLFYLVCGLGADALEIATSLGSDVPGIGASGAGAPGHPTSRRSLIILRKPA